MAGRKRAVTVVATHRYVKDPETAERALAMWSRYLAMSLGRALAERHHGTLERKQAGLP